MGMVRGRSGTLIKTVEYLGAVFYLEWIHYLEGSMFHLFFNHKPQKRVSARRPPGLHLAAPLDDAPERHEPLGVRERGVLLHVGPRNLCTRFLFISYALIPGVSKPPPPSPKTWSERHRSIPLTPQGKLAPTKMTTSQDGLFGP